jgi:heat-inducible transcriptional repressor
MSLSERKKKILACVVESYILDGEAVGSKTLQAILDFSVSSATIRNEMASLENIGLLVQPHTSAGRIPTQWGYRYYIDNLMVKPKVHDRFRQYAEHFLEKRADSPEGVLNAGAELLSELTHLPAVATTPSSINARVHKVRFVPTGRHTGMAVLISSDGMVKSQLFRTEFVLTDDMLRVFDKALNNRLAGMPLKEINQAFIQTTALSFGELSLFMPNVLLAVRDAAEEATHISVAESGVNKLLFIDDFDLYSARDILKFMSNKNEVAKLLTGGTGTKVYIGSETGKYELENAGVVVSRYTLGGSTAGAVAVVGPQRMNYKDIVAATEFVADKCGELINQLIQ